MTTRREILFGLTAMLNAFSSRSYCTSADDKFETAKYLLEHGRNLTKCISLLEGSIGLEDSLDKQLYMLGAIAGRLASLVDTIAEWDIFVQEKSNLERKAQSGSANELGRSVSLISPATPDGGNDFDASSPDAIKEIHELAEKMKSCCEKIDNYTFSTLNVIKDCDDLYFYVSSLILLNKSFSMLPAKYIAVDDVREQLYSQTTILKNVNRILEKDPENKQSLILRALVPCIPLLIINSASDRMKFTMSKSGVPVEVLRNSLYQLEDITKGDERQYTLYLFKSLIAFSFDKSRSLLELNRFIAHSPASAILYFFKAELLFDLQALSPITGLAPDAAFEQVRVGSGSPMTGSFALNIPVHRDMRVCFSFLRWRSGLLLSRLLSVLFSFTGSYLNQIKPQEFSVTDLSYAGDVIRVGMTVMDTFINYQPASYQDSRAQKDCLLLGLVNVYGAFEIVKKSNKLVQTDAKSAFLDEHASDLSRAKQLDRQILQ